MIFVIFECGNVWSTREIDDCPKPYSLIKYLRMGDDIDIVYDESAEKKLIMKNGENCFYGDTTFPKYKYSFRLWHL